MDHNPVVCKALAVTTALNTCVSGSISSLHLKNRITGDFIPQAKFLPQSWQAKYSEGEGDVIGQPSDSPIVHLAPKHKHEENKPHITCKSFKYIRILINGTELNMTTITTHTKRR